MARLNVTASTATTMTVDGREVLAFGGCNYLGLSHHPGVLAALSDGAARFGISTTASRETTGNTAVHDQLERDLARFCDQESAILLAEGYTANIAVAQALTRNHGIVLLDAKAHRSLRSAAGAAGLQVFEYEHLNPDSLAWLCRQYGDQGVAVFTDGVFAADGAVAPVPALLRVLPAHRATLVVDDCHGFCVMGAKGSGCIEHFGVSDERLVMTTTLAKGLGCYGGAVLGRQSLVDRVREHADVYRRSTPVPTPIASAASVAIGMLERDRSLIEALRRNTARMRQGFESIKVAVHPHEVPIFTFVLESRERMESVHRELLAEGVYAPYIEYPGGPTPRFFRVTVSASHTEHEIDRLIEGLRTRV